MGAGFGDSGRARALSSQDDFVGLNLFEGLNGGENGPCVSGLGGGGSRRDATDLDRLCNDATDLLGWSFASPSCSVRLLTVLWLDVGLESGSELCRGSSLGILRELGTPSRMLPMPLRMLAVESCRERLEPGCALHLLLTLSFRFSMALCTKPPMPLVGDAGRSKVARDEREGVVRPNDGFSPSVTEPRSMPEEVGRESDCVLSTAGDVSLVGSREFSFIRPGRFLRILPWSTSPPSDFSRRYAAEFAPRSGVCLNHEGSF